MLDPHLIAKTRPLADPANIVTWGEYRITVLADRLFRVEKDVDKIFCDEATEAVWFRDMPPVNFTKEENENEVHIKTDMAELVLCSEFDNSHVILNGKNIALDNSANLRGTYRTLDSCDGDTLYNGYSLYKGSSQIELDMGVISKNGVAVLDYTRSSILTNEGMIRKQRQDELDIYIFAYGKDYRAAVRAFYMICGATPKIPRYALGNWWSRYHEYTDKEYLSVLDRMEDRDIPITVATVDMDWHWNTNNLLNKKGYDFSNRSGGYYGGTSGWTGYSWNTDLFPDYKDFLKKVHEHGCAVTLNLHPADGVRFYEDMYEEMAKEMGIDPKTEERVALDFTSEKFINAYFKILHKPYEHDGVDFWWIDWQQGPRAKAAGIDILWVLNHFHTLDNAKEHTPLILSRYSGIGAHRYPLGFSGDTFVTWKTLKYLPYFTANASNIGFTWWSHDIGGHCRGIKDDELYVRFVQFGVFSPINRLHSTNYDFNTKEPSAYKNGTGLIAEEFLRLRHKMIPYLYSAMLDTNDKGRALIEPMYYEYPNDENAYNCPEQYMFGTELLVAPVVEKGDENGMSRTRVWLPKGTWTDIFTNASYDGGRWVDMVRFMDSIPVLAKDGAFFPLDGRKHTNSTELPDLLKVMCFNGNGEYTLREDNASTTFTSTASDGKQTVSIKASEGSVARKITLEMRNIKKCNVCAYANGESIDVDVRGNDYANITIDSVVPNVEYTIVVEYVHDAFEYRNERYVEALTQIEVSNDYKLELWKLRTIKDDKEFLRNIMTQKELTENEKICLTEAW